MASRKNAKSQLTTVRVPHDVMEEMESLKQDGESSAGFIVTAMRGEILRRQYGDSLTESVINSHRLLALVLDDYDNKKSLIDKIKNEIGEQP